MTRHGRSGRGAGLAASVALGLLLASPLYAETFWIDYTEPTTLADGRPLTDLKGLALYRKLTGEKTWTFVDLLPASSPTGGATRSDAFDLPLKPVDTWTIYVKLCAVREGGAMTPDADCATMKKLRKGRP